MQVNATGRSGDLLLAGLDCVVAFLNQLLHGGIHLLASKFVDGQALHDAVCVVLVDLDREAVDQPSLDAVRAIRWNSH